MSSQLKLFDDAGYVNEELNEVNISEGEDLEGLKRVKEVSQRFLVVNNFDIGKEPKIENLSDDQFIDYIETNNDSIIATKLSEVKLEISFRSLMTNYYTHKEDETKKILVFFLPDDKSSKSIGNPEFKKFITLIFKLDCKEALLISNKDLSPKSKEQVRQCNINPAGCNNIYNIITYKDSNFIDITKHGFIPEVMKIYRNGAPETEKLIRDSMISPNNLPRMLITDPLNKFYRGQPGDIFQIRRKNIIKGVLLKEQIIFRIVVSSNIKKEK